MKNLKLKIMELALRATNREDNIMMVVAQLTEEIELLMQREICMVLSESTTEYQTMLQKLRKNRR